MRKSGFTLIELLAVIVILAIIALIVTPVISNIISDAKDEANKRSVEAYAQAIDYAIVEYQFKTPGNPSYTDKSAVDSSTLTDLSVKKSGQNVTCTGVTITNGAVATLTGCTVGTDAVAGTYSSSSGWSS